MNKLGWLILIYAAGVATYLLITKQPATAPAPAITAEHPADRNERAIRTEARALMRKDRESFVKEIEQRITRLQDLQQALGDEVARAQSLASAAPAQLDTAPIDKLMAEVRTLKKGMSNDGFGDRLAKFEDEWPKLLTRVVDLELRPTGTGRSDPKPATPQEPQRPTLPEADKPDAAAVQSAVAKAMQYLQSNELDVLVLGIEGARKHSVVEALPRLMEILKDSKHEFARQAAAAALGDMKRADAVEALAGALIDRSGIVAQQANRSVRAITGFDSGISPTARIRERRRAKGAIIQWWRMNEEKVRGQLGQPKAPQ